MRPELELRSVDALLSERFVIPSYQRGFRWTSRQVQELLDDLLEFARTRSERPKDSFYCLQPVVVTPREDGAWELIDGQQRLTTILLVLNALAPLVKMLGKAPHSLVYDTRDGSAAFLASPEEERHLANVDYYHIYNAHKSILEWFEGKDGTVKLSLLDCVLAPEERNVRVIWYELPVGANPIDVFVRLNVGKIRLTNAELIRALFLRRGNFADGADVPVDSRLIEALQHEIAREWDALEKRLQDDAFWYFIYDGASSWPARIEYLFKILVAERGLEAPDHDEYATFLAFQQHFGAGDDARQRWREVRQLASRLDEWAADRTLYHLVGYIIATDERRCSDVIVEMLQYRRRSTRRDFERFLRSRIFEQFVGSNHGPLGDVADSKLEEVVKGRLGELSYEGKSRDRVRSALLLFNVATLLRNTGSNLRFPFDLFKKERWDIEHVRSVKSEMPGRPENMQAWLRHVLEYWDAEAPIRAVNDVAASVTDAASTGSDGGSANGAVGLDERSKPQRDALCRRARDLLGDFDRNQFEGLYDDILGFFGEETTSEAEHGVENLALLDVGTNRSYKNAVFPVKRRRILELDKLGTFVPLCTTNVFLKYYSRSVDQMMFWRRDDETDYLDAIVEMLTHFFRGSLR